MKRSCCCWFFNERMVRTAHCRVTPGGCRRAGGGGRAARGGEYTRRAWKSKTVLREQTKPGTEGRDNDNPRRRCLVNRRAPAHGARALRYRASGRSIRWAAGWRRGGNERKEARPRWRQTPEARAFSARRYVPRRSHDATPISLARSLYRRARAAHMRVALYVQSTPNGRRFGAEGAAGTREERAHFSGGK